MRDGCLHKVAQFPRSGSRGDRAPEEETLMDSSFIVLVDASRDKLHWILLTFPLKEGGLGLMHWRSGVAASWP